LKSAQANRFTRPYLEKMFHKQKSAGGVDQDVGPEFKPQYCKTGKKKIKNRTAIRFNNPTLGYSRVGMTDHRVGYFGNTPKTQETKAKIDVCS
jgi:hypothetical protein